MSGCLDKKLYVWNIPRKRVGYMVEGKEMITAAAFVPEFTDSKEEGTPNPNYYLAVATDTGKILFYEAEVSWLLPSQTDVNALLINACSPGGY